MRRWLFLSISSAALIGNALVSTSSCTTKPMDPTCNPACPTTQRCCRLGLAFATAPDGGLVPEADANVLEGHIIETVCVVDEAGVDPDLPSSLPDGAPVECSSVPPQ